MSQPIAAALGPDYGDRGDFSQLTVAPRTAVAARKPKQSEEWCEPVEALVEPRGIEPLTSTMPL